MPPLHQTQQKHQEEKKNQLRARTNLKEALESVVAGARAMPRQKQLLKRLRKKARAKHKKARAKHKNSRGLQQHKPRKSGQELLLRTQRNPDRDSALQVCENDVATQAVKTIKNQELSIGNCTTLSS